MQHQVQIQCDKCNTILNFSAVDEVKRIVKCINCDNEVSVLFTYNIYQGKKFSKVITTDCKFIPESQREKYNY